MKRVTRKAWFGPKRHLGWGWRPQSWQGWVVMAIFLALFIVAAIVVPSVPLKILSVVVLIGLLVGVCAITSDPPGGP